MSGGHRTARNLIVVSAASFAQIIIQFLITLAIAAYFGTETQTQAYTAALVIPTMFAAIITGSLGYVLVPELVQRFEASTNALAADIDNQTTSADETTNAHEQAARQRGGWSLASFLGLLTLLCGAVFSLGIYGAAQPICRLLYPSMAVEPFDLTVRLLQILSVQVVMNAVISWALAVHHSRHQFLQPALGGVLGTGLTLAWIHWGMRFDPAGTEADVAQIMNVAWAINAGSALSVLIHVAPLMKFLAMPSVDWTSLGRLLKLYWPLLAGAAFLRIDPVLNGALAVEFCDERAIAQLGYAQRIMLAIVAIGTSGLSVIAFPQLAERFAREGRESLAEHFALALRRLVLLVVPIAIGVSCFAVRIVSDLLKRGEFTDQDAWSVGMLLIGFMGMFLGASTGELLARGYYVLGDTRTPTLIGALALVVGIGLKLGLIASWGMWGIAFGVSVAFLLTAGTMALQLTRRLGTGMLSGVLSYTVQATAASAIACLVCAVVYSAEVGGTWLAAPTGAGVYFVSLLLFKNLDARLLADVLVKRGRGWWSMP